MATPWIATMAGLILEEVEPGQRKSRQATFHDQLKRDGATILDLVTSLGPHITSDVEFHRSRAVDLLAEV